MLAAAKGIAEYLPPVSFANSTEVFSIDGRHLALAAHAVWILYSGKSTSPPPPWTCWVRIEAWSLRSKESTNLLMVARTISSAACYWTQKFKLGEVVSSESVQFWPLALIYYRRRSGIRKHMSPDSANVVLSSLREYVKIPAQSGQILVVAPDIMTSLDIVFRISFKSRRIKPIPCLGPILDIRKHREKFQLYQGDLTSSSQKVSGPV